MRTVSIICFFLVLVSCNVLNNRDLRITKSISYYGFDEENNRFTNQVGLGSEIINVKEINKSIQNNLVKITGFTLSVKDDVRLQEVEIFTGIKTGGDISEVKKIGITSIEGEFSIEIPLNFKGQLIFWRRSFLATVFDISNK